MARWSRFSSAVRSRPQSRALDPAPLNAFGWGVVKLPAILLALVVFLGRGATAVEVPDELPPDTNLSAGAARDILRLVEGRPDLKDEDILVNLMLEKTTVLWQCLWLRDGGNEVTVLQVRDSDGAYRKPDIADLNSLKFAIRIDLRDKVAKVVAEAADARKNAERDGTGEQGGKAPAPPEGQ